MSHLTVSRCVHRSRLVEGLVDDWQLHHQQALDVYELEELLEESLWLNELARKAWSQLRNELFDEGRLEKFDELDKIFGIFRDSVDRAIKNHKRLAGLIKWAGTEGFEVKRSPELPEAEEEMRRLLARMDAEWPKFDSTRTDESMRAIQAGQFQAIESVIHAQGQRP